MLFLAAESIKKKKKKGFIYMASLALKENLYKPANILLI